MTIIAESLENLTAEYPCPEWCAVDHSGDYEEQTKSNNMVAAMIGDPGRQFPLDVVHGAALHSGEWGRLDIDQPVRAEGGPTGYLPQIRTDGIAPDGLDAEGARELAAALIAAAELLDTITAGASA